MMKPNLVRLEHLVRVLENVPNEKFDLGHWLAGDPQHPCRTTGCAVGWATTDPWFKRRGLAMAGNTGGMLVYTEKKRGETFRHIDFRAAEKFFSLTGEQADYLFYEGRYTRGSRYDVIRRVKKFVKEQRAER